MLIRVVAVGTRMPAWVTQAADDYSGRLPPEIRVEWREVRAEARSGRDSPEVWMSREAQRIRGALPDGAHLVVLDEHGVDLDTRGFALAPAALAARRSPRRDPDRRTRRARPDAEVRSARNASGFPASRCRTRSCA